MSQLAFLALVLLLALLAVREDSPTATTPRRAWEELRAAGWKRVLWLILLTALRTGVYGAALAVAALGCAAADLTRLERRHPVRLRRVEVKA